MPPCLTLSIIRYGSRVKCSNPGKGVAPFPTAIEKRAFESPSTKVANFTYTARENGAGHFQSKSIWVYILKINLYNVAIDDCCVRDEYSSAGEVKTELNF